MAESTTAPSAASTSFWAKHKATVQSIVLTIKKSIPSSDVQNLPVKQMLLLGVIIQCASLGIFVYFLLSGFYDARQNKFLSLQSDAGDCENVLKSLSGLYLADSNGNWEGASGFAYTSANYQFYFANLLVTESAYHDIIESVQDQLSIVGEDSNTLGLVFNLILWISYKLVYKDGISVQNFYMSGDPMTIFNREHLRGSVGNLYADCNAESEVSFDVDTGLFSLYYVYSDFISNENCSTVLKPLEFGYDPSVDDEYFSIQYDIRSIATAIAVNSGYIYLDQLEIIPEWEESYDLSNNQSTASKSYYDPRYPGMLPITCIQPDNGSPVCAVSLGYKVAVPLLNHFGASNDYPEYCHCHSTIGHSEECNQFNFLSGFLMYNTSDPAPLIELTTKYKVRELYALAYPSMYAAVSVGVTDKYQNETFRVDAYDFCNNTHYGGCSIVSINSYDNIDRSVTAYYYQLSNGSCENTLSGTDAAWDKLKNYPPVAVVESYFECSKTWSDALTESAGIATGFTSTIIPLIVILLLQLVYFWRSHFGKETYSNRFCDDCDEDRPSDDEELSTVLSEHDVLKPKKDLTYRTYSKETRDNFLGSMSLQMLMMRDRRLSAASPCDAQSESLIHRLMEELKANAAASPANLITVAHYSNLPKYCHEFRVKKNNVCSSDVCGTSAEDSKASYSALHPPVEDLHNRKVLEMRQMNVNHSNGSTVERLSEQNVNRSGEVALSTESIRRLEQISSSQEKKILELESDNALLRGKFAQMQDSLSKCENLIRLLQSSSDK